MIKEFALDPEAIVGSFRDFCYFIEKFSVGQGRVISRFPKKWKRLVHDAAKAKHFGTAELTAIVDKLNTCGGDILFDAGRPSGHGNQRWIERTLTEHAREPFSGIITDVSPCGDDRLLPATKLDESNPVFQSASHVSVRRTANSLAGCAAFLVTHAKTIKLIDPYLDPWREDYRNTLTCIFEILGQNSVEIEIHRNDDVATDEMVRRIGRFVSKACNPNATVRLYIHPKSSMHNRYILTETGGVMFGEGLNEDDALDNEKEDDVSLMVESVRARRWDEYGSDGEVMSWSA